MKALFITSLIVVIIFAGCKTDESIPTKPNNNQTTGNGILAGYASYTSQLFEDRYIHSMDLSGLKVELVGTTLTTETDTYGRWVIRGIDSGAYTVRYTKPYYDTVELNNIFCNGTDSTYVTYSLTDSLGNQQTYRQVTLIELPSGIQLSSASAIAQANIKTDTLWNNGTIQEITRDTSYHWQGEFSVNVDAKLQSTNEAMNVGFLVRLTNTSTIAPSAMPQKFYDTGTELTNGWLGFFGASKLTKPPYAGTRNFVVSDNGSISDRRFDLNYFANTGNYTVANGVQIYLHIIPVYKEVYRDTGKNRFGTWDGPTQRYTFGDVTSVPIQWQ